MNSTDKSQPIVSETEVHLNYIECSITTSMSLIARRNVICIGVSYYACSICAVYVLHVSFICTCTTCIIKITQFITLIYTYNACYNVYKADAFNLFG